jgi:hypothetical protein
MVAARGVDEQHVRGLVERPDGRCERWALAKREQAGSVRGSGLSRDYHSEG